MAFHNVLLATNVSQGMQSVTMGSTSRVSSTSGYNQANQNWPFPLHRYDVSHVLPNRAKRLALKAFFILRGMGAHSFRVLDWADYFVGMNWVSGSLDHVGPHVFAVADGAATVYQLGIRYKDAYAEVFRPITKPVGPDFAGTVKIYFGATIKVEGTHYTIDYNTGLVTFLAAPAVGIEIGWSGRFHVECYFESDEAIFELETPHTGAWGSITLRELGPDEDDE